MISQTDPDLLSELYQTLTGENEPPVSCLRHKEEDGGGGGRGTATLRRRTRSTLPLSNHDLNSRNTSTNAREARTCSGCGITGTGGPKKSGEPGGVSRSAVRRGSGAATRGVGLKGRRLGTPTKAAGDSRLPELKSARRVSPRKDPPKPAQKEVPLSEDQQRALDLVMHGKSIFFTGEPWPLVSKVSG